MAAWNFLAAGNHHDVGQFLRPHSHGTQKAVKLAGEIAELIRGNIQKTIAPDALIPHLRTACR